MKEGDKRKITSQANAAKAREARAKRFAEVISFDSDSDDDALPSKESEVDVQEALPSVIKEPAVTKEKPKNKAAGKKKEAEVLPSDVEELRKPSSSKDEAIPIKEVDVIKEEALPRRRSIFPSDSVTSTNGRRDDLKKRKINVSAYTSMLDGKVNIVDELIKRFQSNGDGVEDERPARRCIFKQEAVKKEAKKKYIAPEYIIIFDDLSNELKNPAIPNVMPLTTLFTPRNRANPRKLGPITKSNNNQITFGNEDQVLLNVDTKDYAYITLPSPSPEKFASVVITETDQSINGVKTFRDNSNFHSNINVSNDVYCEDVKASNNVQASTMDCWDITAQNNVNARAGYFSASIYSPSINPFNSNTMTICYANQGTLNIDTVSAKTINASVAVNTPAINPTGNVSIAPTGTTTTKVIMATTAVNTNSIVPYTGTNVSIAPSGTTTTNVLIAANSVKTNSITSNTGTDVTIASNGTAVWVLLFQWQEL
eukprot:gene18158-21716_t